jgi:hypothetical protein
MATRQPNGIALDSRIRQQFNKLPTAPEPNDDDITLSDLEKLNRPHRNPFDAATARIPPAVRVAPASSSKNIALDSSVARLGDSARLYTRSAYINQPSRPSDAVISAHSRFDSPLPFCSTVSPASIRLITASIVAENVTAPIR